MFSQSPSYNGYAKNGKHMHRQTEIWQNDGDHGFKPEILFIIIIIIIFIQSPISNVYKDTSSVDL